MGAPTFRAYRTNKDMTWCLSQTCSHMRVVVPRLAPVVLPQPFIDSFLARNGRYNTWLTTPLGAGHRNLLQIPDPDSLREIQGRFDCHGAAAAFISDATAEVEHESRRRGHQGRVSGLPFGCGSTTRH